MKQRYRTFSENDFTFPIMEDHPGEFPIIDTNSAFVSGEIIGFALDKKTAERMVRALNVLNNIEKFLES